MCNFCEPYVHGEDDENKMVDCLYDSSDGMACIVGPTPITRRHYAESGLFSALLVSIGHEDLRIPIKYCPICGREIK